MLDHYRLADSQFVNEESQNSSRGHMRIKETIRFILSPHPNDLHPLPTDFPSVYIMSGRFNIYASPHLHPPT